jgi:hypothetical protein
MLLPWRDPEDMKMMKTGRPKQTALPVERKAI